MSNAHEPNDGPGVATFHLIPKDAVLLNIDGGIAWTTLSSGRYVELPGAIAALRDIAAHGDAWSARRAKEGLSGWR